MSRPIVLSNGELHVGLNNFGLVHDFYYPYVGFENHAAGEHMRHHIGIYIDGHISWLDDGQWKFTFSYPHESLVGRTVATNTFMQVMLEFDDTVDAEFSALMRNVHVINLSDSAREIRLFFHQAFVIGDSRSNTDTAQYLPDANAILHYRGRRAFIVSGQAESKEWFDQYTVGLFGIEGREGTYKDAEDGELSGCVVEHGRVDSTIRFTIHLPPHESSRVQYWIACSTSTREALYIHKQIIKQTLHVRLDKTVAWWAKWLEPAKATAQKLDPAHQERFLQSIMIIKSHIDKRGAVIASTDTAMLNYSRDAYAYCWPRDGAYVVWPLIRLGYKDEPYRFFEFCRRAMSANGYLMHKFRADGALGSSWHPYLHPDGTVTPPIQEDETALVLFVFSQYYHVQQDPVLLKEFYHTMVMPMADFLAGYVCEKTGLPKASYDLWEEQFMITTYTTSVVFAALQAAADLAEIKQDTDNAVKWRAAAESIFQAAHKHLYNAERKSFYKGVRCTLDGTITYDGTIDNSSIYGGFMYGLFPIGSDEMTNAVETSMVRFNISENQWGLPRYEDDRYRRTNDQVTGNWWYIASLWMAQYYLEVGLRDKAMQILAWVRDSAMPTGVLFEQVDPSCRQPVSVAPLAWSQAEYVSTLLDTITRA